MSVVRQILESDIEIEVYFLFLEINAIVKYRNFNGVEY